MEDVVEGAEEPVLVGVVPLGVVISGVPVPLPVEMGVSPGGIDMMPVSVTLVAPEEPVTTVSVNVGTGT